MKKKKKEKETTTTKTTTKIKYHKQEKFCKGQDVANRLIRYRYNRLIRAILNKPYQAFRVLEQTYCKSIL